MGKAALAESLFHILPMRSWSRTSVSAECHSGDDEQQFQRAAVAALQQTLRSEKPLKVPHPITFQGSTRNLAPALLGYFPERVGTLIELFAGSVAITLAAAACGLARRHVINNLNNPLVDLW